MKADAQKKQNLQNQSNKSKKISSQEDWNGSSSEKIITNSNPFAVNPQNSGNPFTIQRKEQNPFKEDNVNKNPFLTEESIETAHSSIQAKKINQQPIQADWGDRITGFAKGVAGGVLSVGEDIVGGTHRTMRGLNLFNQDELARIGFENERAYNMIIAVFENTDLLEKIISHTIADIYEQLPPQEQQKVKEKFLDGAVQGAGYVVGRMIVGTTIVKSIIKRIAVRVAASQAFKAIATRLGVSAAVGSTGVGVPVTLVMVQGVLERASRASRRLQSTHPRLRARLVAENLDMAWFLVEPHYNEIASTMTQ